MASLQVSEQFGGAAFDDVTEHGSKSLREIIEMFDSKRWADEASKAEITGLCAPTISLNDAGSGSVFWVSPYLDGGELTFVNEYRYRLVNRGFLARLMRRTHEAPPTRELTRSEARRALQLFAEERHGELLRLVRPA